MKNVLLVLAAFLLITNCKEKEQHYFTEGPEIELFKEFTNKYEAADWENWVDFYSPNAKTYHNQWSDSRTPAELLELIKLAVAPLSSHTFDDDFVIEKIIDKDGKTWVNYWANWRGKFSETGKEITMPIHISANFVNGKIVEEYAMYNMSEWLSEIDALEKSKKQSEDENVESE